MTNPLASSALRWACPDDVLAFETTGEVEPERGIVGQERAKRALAFGLSIRSRSHNVFMRGQEGTGRLTLVKRLLERPGLLEDDVQDRVFVLDFDQLDRPALLSLPGGRGPKLQRAMDRFLKNVRADLVADVEDAVRQLQRPLQEGLKVAMSALSDPFEAALTEDGLALVQVVDEDGDREPMILPVVDGEAAPFQQLAAAVEAGALEASDLEALQAAAKAHTETLFVLQQQMSTLERQHERDVDELVEQEARRQLDVGSEEMRSSFPAAERFFEQVISHIVDHLSLLKSDGEALTSLYEVNVLPSRSPGSKRPVVYESAPSLQALLGTIDTPITENTAPHKGIHMGSLYRANGGFLVLNAHSVLREDGAWDALIRSLRTREIQLLPSDQPTTLRPPGIKPAPIPIDVKVVLIGEDQAWHLLAQNDPDFLNLFKVLADFDPVLPIEPESIERYGRVVGGITRKNGLPDFTRGAVVALVEHGVRIGATGGHVSTRFGRIADVAREAAWCASGDVVRADDVVAALDAARDRADGPSALFRQRVAEGSLRLATSGTAVGELNGLAVIAAGPEAYGMPMRITASAGPGTDGPVNVEHEALLSGQIHIKSFHILKGLLRRLIDATHPVTLDASIAFEQSYGGIDGDSASGASFCVLLSAITGLPVRQDLAMTGAVDQVGSVMPIGAVNEKIEGFFDICQVQGSTGTQSVIIPVANASDLMLRRDIVAAAEAGEFHIYAIDRIEQALELFFSLPAEEVMEKTREKLHAFWEVTSP